MERWLLLINILIPYDRGLGLQIQNLVQVKTTIGVVLTMSIYKCCAPVNVLLRLVDGFDVSIKIPLAKEPAFNDTLCVRASASIGSGRWINRLAEFCSKYDFAFERYTRMAAYKWTRALSNSVAAAEPVEG